LKKRAEGVQTRQAFPELRPCMARHLNLSATDIQVEERLGEGSFCQLWKGKCRKKPVLVRILKSTDIEHEAYCEEVKRLSKIRNPHIVLFMGACLEPGYYALVTEYMPSNLEIKLLQNKNRKDMFTLYKRLKMAKDAALGIQWLHKMNTYHMNLHLSNFLVDNDDVVKIADFGFFNTRRKCAERPDLANLVYMPPEYLSDGRVSEKCDVYSFACCLTEILTGQGVFKTLKTQIRLSSNPESLLYEKIVTRGTRPKILPEHVPSSLVELLRRSLETLPEKRPNFDQIIAALDSAMIDAAINDEAGRTLWRKKLQWTDPGDMG